MSIQSTRKTIRTLTTLFCTSGLKLVVLAWTGELLCGQAQNGVNFDFEVKFDFEGQSQSTPETIGILTKVLYTYGPNLVNLVWTGDELSRGQTWWRTDGRMQAPTIPGGSYWPRVKIKILVTQFWGQYCCADSSQISERSDENWGILWPKTSKIPIFL